MEQEPNLRPSQQTVHVRSTIMISPRRAATARQPENIQSSGGLAACRQPAPDPNAAPRPTASGGNPGWPVRRSAGQGGPAITLRVIGIFLRGFQTVRAVLAGLF